MLTISTPTIEDAARFWIGRDFSMVSTTLVQKAFAGDAMEGLELLAGGQQKSDCHDADTETRAASQDEIESDDAGHSHYHVTDGKIPVCGDCGQPCSTHWEGAVYNWPAVHGMMFTPDDRIDQDWIRSNAVEIAEKCGFLIYESDETGIILGIDGGGMISTTRIGSPSISCADSNGTTRRQHPRRQSLPPRQPHASAPASPRRRARPRSRPRQPSGAPRDSAGPATFGIGPPERVRIFRGFANVQDLRKFRALARWRRGPTTKGSHHVHRLENPGRARSFSSSQISGACASDCRRFWLDGPKAGSGHGHTPPSLYRWPHG